MDVETTAQTPRSTNTGKNVSIGHFMKKNLNYSYKCNKTKIISHLFLGTQRKKRRRETKQQEIQLDKPVNVKSFTCCINIYLLAQMLV